MINSNQNTVQGIQASLTITNSTIFSGAQPFVIQNAVVIFGGTTVYNCAGVFQLFYNSLLINSAGSNFNVLLPVKFGQNDQAEGYITRFRNFGNVYFSASAAGSTLSMNVQNSINGQVVVAGLVEMQSGFYTQEPGSISTFIASNASLQVASGVAILGGVLFGILRLFIILKL